MIGKSSLFIKNTYFQIQVNQIVVNAWTTNFIFVVEVWSVLYFSASWKSNTFYRDHLMGNSQHTDSTFGILLQIQYLFNKRFMEHLLEFSLWSTNRESTNKMHISRTWLIGSRNATLLFTLCKTFCGIWLCLCLNLCLCLQTFVFV